MQVNRKLFTNGLLITSASLVTFISPLTKASMDEERKVFHPGLNDSGICLPALFWPANLSISVLSNSASARVAVMEITGRSGLVFFLLVGFFIEIDLV